MNSKKQAEGAYLICQHPDHAAVAEIFTMREYRKIFAMDGAYCVLWTGNSWEEAAEHLRQLVDKVYQKDPGLMHLKHDMEEMEG